MRSDAVAHELLIETIDLVRRLWRKISTAENLQALGAGLHIMAIDNGAYRQLAKCRRCRQSNPGFESQEEDQNDRTAAPITQVP